VKISNDKKSWETNDEKSWVTIYDNKGKSFLQLRVEAGGREARFVRVQLAERNFFHLAEVQLYGKKKVDVY